MKKVVFKPIPPHFVQGKGKHKERARKRRGGHQNSFFRGLSFVLKGSLALKAFVVEQKKKGKTTNKRQGSTCRRNRLRSAPPALKILASEKRD